MTKKFYWFSFKTKKKITVIDNLRNVLINRELKKIKESYILELGIKKEVDFLIIKNNRKRYKLKIDPSYKYLYIEFRDVGLLEVVYTNKKPVYT